MSPRIPLVLCLLAAPAVAQAQLPSWLRPGARLRLTQESARDQVVGELLRFDAESVSLRTSAWRAPITLPLAGVSGVEVSLERRSKAKSGALTGLAIGFSLGALTILSSSEVTDDTGATAAGIAVFGGVFGLLGAGIGGLIGSTIKSDVWEPVGRVNVGLSIPW